MKWFSSSLGVADNKFNVAEEYIANGLHEDRAKVMEDFTYQGHCMDSLKTECASKSLFHKIHLLDRLKNWKTNFARAENISQNNIIKVFWRISHIYRKGAN